MKVKRLGIGVLVFFLLGYSVATDYTVPLADLAVGGRTLYVGGDGPNNYSSIQDAIDDAMDGDTIFVYSGVYYENINISSKTLIIKGEDRETTIIDGNHNWNTISIEHANNIEISGFTIKNSKLREENAGIYIKNSNYCKIHDCKIILSSHGMFVLQSYHNEISDCVFSNNQRHNLLITVSSNHNKVKNCTFSNAGWTALYLYDSDSNTIENCVAENCEAGFVVGWECNDIDIKNCSSSNNYYNGIFVYNAKNVEIENCHFYQNGDGIRIRRGSSNVKVENCIMENNVFGMQILQQSSNIEVYFNNIMNNEIGVYVNGSKENIKINYNNIIDNNGKGVVATNNSIVDARNNYWGTIFGPITFGLLGDGIFPLGGKIYFFPWSFNPFETNFRKFYK